MTINQLKFAVKPCAKVPLLASQQKLETIRASEHGGCLLCGSNNPFGFKLCFNVEKDGSVTAELSCKQIFQSYTDTLHGGVISALLDSAMTNALFAVGIIAVTAELTVRFKKPVRLDKDIAIWAKIAPMSFPPLYYLKGELTQDKRLMAKASAKFLAKELLE